MKGLWILGLGVASALFGNTIELGSFAVDPTSSILFANMNPAHSDNPTGPIFINLDELAVASGLGKSLVGYVLQLRASGSMCYTALVNNSCPVIPTQGFLAAFDSDTIAHVGAKNPLPGAIKPEGDYEGAFPETYYDHMKTSMGPPNLMIYNDLFTSVIVPGGTHYLAVGLYDSFFADNSGNLSLQLRVQVPDQPVPEPLTGVLTVGGLFALVAAKRTLGKSLRT